jgi:hypothetical protein
MAIVLVESFDLYSTVITKTDGTGILTNWQCAFPSDSSIIAGRYAGQALRKPAAGGVEPWYRTLPVKRTTFTVGFDWRNSTTNTEIFHLMTGTGTEQITLTGDATGAISVRRGGASGTILGTTPAAQIAANVWSYIEIGITLSTTVGTVDLWIEGSHVLSLTGQNTWNNSGAGGFDTLQVPENNGTTDVDNIVVQDVIGSLGPLRVDPFFPNGDVSTGTFAPNSGSTLYTQVSENPNDQDTTYIESGTTGDQCLMNIQDVTGSLNIIGLCATYVAKTGGGSGRGYGAVISDGVNTIVGGTITLGAAYAFTQTMFMTAPDGSGWTTAKFNATQGGIKVTL